MAKNFHYDISKINASFQYDYTKCMMMKLGMAYPEKDRKTSHVLMTFEQALDVIKKIDFITQGITKIYYLVGWQYLGHDDKYPDFFEVNETLKRPGDKTARESFLWLYEEAKKYNSVVSVHINFNDAYDNAPSFNDFKAANALIRKRNGKIHAVENYNKRPCYKTDLTVYWKSGLFKRQFDRLLETLPFLKDAKTIHVDNFQCYHNYAPEVTIAQMQEARKKMIEYVKDKGIDITSEFTYKEDESLPNKKLFGLPREHHFKTPMNTLGLIPASWWCTRMTRHEYVEIPPQLYSGGMYKDKYYKNYLYGNMHGEDIIHPNDPNWTEKFIHDFATVQIPYHFLCCHKRLEIKGYAFTERCIFSDGIISYNQKHKIVWDGQVMKEKDTLFLPMATKENTWIAYSKIPCERTWNVMESDSQKADIYKITANGNKFIKTEQIKDKKITFNFGKNEAFLVCFKK